MLETAPQLSVVVPMYNESESIASTVDEIRATLDERDLRYELILVDDGSTDGTPDVAGKISEEMTSLRVCCHPINLGRGMALRTGFAEARAEIVVSIGADLSYDPPHILRLYDELAGNPSLDMAIASVYMPGGKVIGDPIFRYLISRVGNIILSIAVGGKIRTVTCMLRAYRRHVIESLDLESEGKELHLEIISKAIALGYHIKEIPAINKARTTGKSKFKFGSTSVSHLLFSVAERPTVIFGVLGMILFVLGLAGGFRVTWLWWNGDLDTTGRTLLVPLVVLLSIFGLQAWCLGFISTQLISVRKELYRIQRENSQLKGLIRRIPAVKERADDAP
ncbi:glycosyltransferase family 2 protein [Candidatus Hydrogenedentota bacterium]